MLHKCMFAHFFSKVFCFHYMLANKTNHTMQFKKELGGGVSGCLYRYRSPYTISFVVSNIHFNMLVKKTRLLQGMSFNGNF